MTSSNTTLTIFDRLTQRNVQILESGSDDTFRCVAFSPDAKTVAAAAFEEGWVQVWEVQTGVIKKTLEVANGRVRAIAYSHDGSFLAAAAGKQVIIWDLGNGGDARVLRFPENETASMVAFSPIDEQLLAVGTRLEGHGRLAIRSVLANVHAKSVGELDYTVSALAFTADGSKLIAGSGGTIHTFDVSVTQDGEVGIAVTGQPLNVNGEVLQLGCGLDSEAIAIAKRAEGAEVHDRLSLWSLNRRQELLTFPLRGLRAALSADCCYLLTSNEYRSEASIWSLKDRSELAERYTGTGDISFSSDGRKVAAGLSGGFIQVWDRDTGRRSLSLKAGDIVERIVLNDSGTWLATATYDGNVTVWDTKDGRQKGGFKCGIQLSAMDVSPNGKWIASGVYKPTIRKLGSHGDVEEILVPYVDEEKLGSQKLYSMAFSPDSQYLASGDGGAFVRLYEISAEWPYCSLLKFRHFYSGTQYHYALGLAYSPSGEQLALATAGGLYVLDVSNNTLDHELRTPVDGEDKIRAVAYGPKGQWLAAGAKQVILWETGSWQKKVSLEFPGSTVDGLRFNSDGSLLAAVGHGVVFVWRMAELERLLDTAPRDLLDEAEQRAGIPGG